MIFILPMGRANCFIRSLCIFLFCVQYTHSRCSNACSGHGKCSTSNNCDCFEGWRGGAADCSLRKLAFFLSRLSHTSNFLHLHTGDCPYGIAWADKPSAIDVAHVNAECSNAGICNRGSGQCECFNGFTGHACQRSTRRFVFRLVNVI